MLRQLHFLYRAAPSLRLTLLGAFTGLFTGLAAALFYWAIETARYWMQIKWAGLAQAGGPARLWLIPLLLGGVGLFTGWLVQRFVPGSIEGTTDGTDSFIQAFHKRQGRLPGRLPLIKGFTSILTIGAGGSAGSKGPVSQIGAGVGSLLARCVGLSPRERRILLVAGAAGGLGAIFRAPLGGALMAIEVLYREDFEAEALVPAVLSSVVSLSVFSMVHGAAPFMQLPEFSFAGWRQLPFYAVLAVVCALVGWLYVRTFRIVKYSVFSRLRARIGIMWTAALGGLLAGMFGMLYQPALADGYAWIEQAVLGQLTITAMLVMLFAKILATSLTLGAGLSGGMIAPSLYVGAMTGGCVGWVAHRLFPDMVAQPGAFALVGMTAFFAGIAHAPIGPMVLLCEFTKGYELLAPLMLCSVLSLLLCRRVSLYEHQEENKFSSPAHREDATVNVLAASRVADFYTPSDVTIVEAGLSLRALADIIINTQAQIYPVRGVETAPGPNLFGPDPFNSDPSGSDPPGSDPPGPEKSGGPENTASAYSGGTTRPLSGIIAVEDIRPILYKEELFDLVVAAELARPPVLLTEDADLYAALIAFVESGLSELPVVDAARPGVVLGLLHRADVFRAYHSALKDAGNE